MEEWKKDRIGSCEREENPTLICKMKSGFAVMADSQFLPGYVILLRYPKVDSFSDLTLEERSQYLIDTTLIGDALNKVCTPRKINYSTLMNKDNYLHTHIEARYDWESDEYKYGPSWAYPNRERWSEKYEFSEEKHCDLKHKLAAELKKLMEQSGY